MVKRRKVSPAKFMMKQWKEISDLEGDIGCTSLVTCIAKNLCLLKMLLLLKSRIFPVGLLIMNILSKPTC
jgi:hypothetical protein